MDAFDADALIYAAIPGHQLGGPVRAMFIRSKHGLVGIGSLLLLPEVLAKPMRDGVAEELSILTGLLSRLDLQPLNPVTAEVATSLAAEYRLRAADAIHLATAVVAGADRFITNNRRDFAQTISEIDIRYPDTL